MSLDTSLPKALHQANIDLALRIAALLQENGKQWYDLFAEEARARLGKGLSQLGVLKGMTPESLSALPTEMAAQLLNIDAGRWQSLLSEAVEHQTRFADGVKNALDTWQTHCTEALTASMEGMPNMKLDAVLPNLDSMLGPMRDVLTQFMPQVAACATPKAAASTTATEPGKAAESKPEPKKAAAPTVTKAVVKKTPVKKAAAPSQPVAAPAAKKAAPASKKPAVAKKAANKVAVKTVSAPKPVAPLAPSLAPNPLPRASDAPADKTKG